jgi:hypothetical protein
MFTSGLMSDVPQAPAPEASPPPPEPVAPPPEPVAAIPEPAAANEAAKPRRFGWWSKRG